MIEYEINEFSRAPCILGFEEKECDSDMYILLVDD